MQLTVSICLIEYFYSLEMCRVIYIDQNKGVPSSFYIIAQSFQHKVKGELTNTNVVPFMLLTFRITLCANIYQSQNVVKKNIYIYIYTKEKQHFLFQEIDTIIFQLPNHISTPPSPQSIMAD